MKRNYFLWIGIAMFAILAIMMLSGPVLSLLGNDIQPERLRFYEDGKVEKAPFPPSKKDWFGTDDDGRDIFTLIIMGTKDTLLIVFTITLIRYLLAIPLGLFASKKRGTANWILNSLNSLFSILPSIFSTIILINLPFLIFSDNRVFWVIFIIALVEVGKTGTIIQEHAYDISQKEFIDAAITLGNSPIRLFGSHYLPVMLPEIIVNFFIDLGRVTMLIGQLGIFSIFVQQQWIQEAPMMGTLKNTSINWATLLSEARVAIFRAPWIPLFPAIAIVYTIFTFNILGEGLRKHFNRRTA